MVCYYILYKLILINWLTVDLDAYRDIMLLSIDFLKQLPIVQCYSHSIKYKKNNGKKSKSILNSLKYICYVIYVVRFLFLKVQKCRTNIKFKFKVSILSTKHSTNKQKKPPKVIQLQRYFYTVVKPFADIVSMVWARGL